MKSPFQTLPPHVELWEDQRKQKLKSRPAPLPRSPEISTRSIGLRVRSLLNLSRSRSRSRSRPSHSRRRENRSWGRRSWLSCSLFRIEILAKSVTDKVERENGERDRDPGEEQNVRSVVENVESACLLDHR